MDKRKEEGRNILFFILLTLFRVGWKQRKPLNKFQSWERLLAWEGDLTSLEGDERPRSLYVLVSVMEKRRRDGLRLSVEKPYDLF